MKRKQEETQAQPDPGGEVLREAAHGHRSCFWGAHPVLDAGHSAVGVAQRVRQPVHAVAGLPIPVEAHGNSSTAEEEKQQRAEVRLKGKCVTWG